MNVWLAAVWVGSYKHKLQLIIASGKHSLPYSFYCHIGILSISNTLNRLAWAYVPLRVHLSFHQTIYLLYSCINEESSHNSNDFQCTSCNHAFLNSTISSVGYEKRIQNDNIKLFFTYYDLFVCVFKDYFIFE